MAGSAAAALVPPRIPPRISPPWRDLAPDHHLLLSDDKSPIGLLLCRSKNKLIVGYAQQSLARSIGVAEWETKLHEKLVDDLRGCLPNVRENDVELAEEGAL